MLLFENKLIYVLQAPSIEEKMKHDSLKIRLLDRSNLIYILLLYIFWGGTGPQLGVGRGNPP